MSLRLGVKYRVLSGIQFYFSYTVCSVHKKHNKLVHLLKSGGERGMKGVKVNILNGKKEKGGKEAEREKGE